MKSVLFFLSFSYTMIPLFVILCIGFFNPRLVFGQGGCEQITLDECRPGGLCTQTPPNDIPSLQECQDRCHNFNEFGLCQSFIYNDKTKVCNYQHF